MKLTILLMIFILLSINNADSKDWTLTYWWNDIQADNKGRIWLSNPHDGLYILDPSQIEGIDFKDISLNISLELFPNPVSDYLTIYTNQGIGKIEIFSALGVRVIIVETGLKPVSTAKVDVSGLPPGVYFVRVGDKINKFVKH